MRVASRRALLVGAVTAAVGTAAAVPVLAAQHRGADLVPVAATAGTPVPGRYIVTMKGDASAQNAANQARATAVQKFDTVLNGFVAKANADQLARLRRDPQVAAIEQDQIVKISDTQKSPLPWGLDRVDQRRLPLSKSYGYKTKAANVTAYVIDTGIAKGLGEFGGRADVAWVASEFNGNGADCNGHGTHVAGILGSKTYGVAKGVKIRALRVLDCKGEGYMSSIVSAAQWLRTHAAKPAVANISVGGPKSAALNTAVMNLSKSGVFVSVAAGNAEKPTSDKNACHYSPSSAGWVETVGATTSHDNRPSWSNYGKCVDIHAPGYAITSTWPKADSSGHYRKSLSGTSMATPYVSGTAALYLATHPKATFPQVQKWLSDNSTKNRIGGLPKGTANKLLYKSNL
ncbi:S8 family peptidase [Actinomadura parmotrematis]|uniref:S8 family peptidase n=1 Tax=Actinomadura parmotrematis TaxID=2864039 RepID=A0ABS7FNV3_9ACTN|nr:S8 family peptidase [Actinomadura parmotrematis]MBW8482073.1 S8 family peptidase [Actinomadura parmotrematis]